MHNRSLMHLNLLGWPFSSECHLLVPQFARLSFLHVAFFPIVLSFVCKTASNMHANPIKKRELTYSAAANSERPIVVIPQSDGDQEHVRSIAGIIETKNGD